MHPMMGEIPFDLYPYQRQLLASRAAQRIILKARQVGVSQLVAGEALYLAAHVDGATVLFVSRNLQAAQHLQRMVYQLMASDPILPEAVRKTDAELAFANGSVIRSLPATEETGRTYAATAVYLDEFAHMPWADRIYQAVAPCVARGGRLTIISTPHGRGNAFYRLWQEALAGERDFARFRVHWADCPEYNPDGYRLPDPEARQRVGEQDMWYRLQRPKYRDEMWAEEFECDFVGSSYLVYREFDPEAHVADYSYNPDWPTYVGQDFGYINPAAALVIQLNPAEEVFVIQELYHTNRSIAQLAYEFYRPLCERFRVKAWYCDPSGPSQISDLRQAGIPASGRRSTVEEGVTLIRKLLRPPGGGPPRLHIDRSCDNLISEMSAFSYRDDRETIAEGHDHGPDALRYFVVNHWAGAAQTEGLALR